MDEDPRDDLEPDEEPENHVLIVGLRIAFVTLVVIVGILLVSKYLVAKLDLHGDHDSSGFVSGPVPVSPIPQDGTSTASAEPVPAQTDSYDTSLPTLSAPPAPTDIPPSDPVPPGLVLTITPTSVSSGQTFTVSGTYAGRDGVTLQLQRMENGIWADYPNQITVSMGSYSTTASSTLTGTNSFRIYDQTANRPSNVVSILVR